MLILGLDIGTSSIGWSLVDDTNQKILNTGGNIFPEGVNRSPLGKEDSKNASRRMARQIRRQKFRKHQRKENLIKFLQDLAWCPIDEPELMAWKALNPYELREKAVNEKISLTELGRILYHLNQRRGFKSSRKSGTNDEGAMYKGSEGKIGITELENEIQKGGYKTLGEYLAKLNPHEKRLRNRYILRRMYEDEFEMIWATQLKFYASLNKPKDFERLVQAHCFKKYHKKLLVNDLKFTLKDYFIYYQRGLKSQKGLIGKCTLEPSKRRTVKSSLIFQEFRILDKLYSIRINGKGRTDSPLSPDERAKAFEKLNTSKELTIKDLLKHLKLEDYEANYAQDDKIKGNRTATELIKVFGKGWHQFDDAQKHKIWEIVNMADDDKWLKNYGIQKWNLSPESVEKFPKKSFEKSYAELSHKALSRLVPLMKNENLPYNEACLKLGYHHTQIIDNQSVKQNLLGEPQNLRNPIVQQALYMLRKLVNTIIQEYGLKPDIIRVELARELKMKKKDREKIYDVNKKAKDEHNRIVKELLKEIPAFQKESDISREDIIKYKLYEECAKICPYTGKSINISQLYNGEFEIEHIIPFSRSLDDSFNNKTLCERNFNLRKGKYTPFELQENGMMSQIDYEAMIERVKKFKRNGKFNYRKFKKFLQKTVDADFANRQLNDTAWIAKEAKTWLSTICEKVQISMGTATAELRHLWGLNNVLNKYELNVKNREDHRHHALDAIVVALTSPGMLQALSKNHEKGYRTSSKQFPLPWENFRLDVKDAINQILIKQKRKKRVRGKLHEETFFGAVLEMDGRHKKEKDMFYYTIRKPLESLSPAMIDKIADDMVKEVIKHRIEVFPQIQALTFSQLKERVKNLQKDKVKEKKVIPVGCFNEPLYMPNKKGLKIQIKKVRIHEVGSNKIALREGLFVDSGNNHHIVIFEKSDGKRDGKVVSLYEATQRQKYKQPIINKEVGKDNKFIMSLAKDEMVLIDNEDFKTHQIDWNKVDKEYLSTYLYRVQKIESGQLTITFRHHLVAVLKNEEGVEIGRKFANPNTFKGIKVKISPLGDISPADD